MTDMSSPLDPGAKERLQHAYIREVPFAEELRRMEPSPLALATERAEAAERTLARIANDARAALAETTYAELENQHRLMANALYTVTQALTKRGNAKDDVLLTFVRTTLTECGQPSYDEAADLTRSGSSLSSVPGLSATGEATSGEPT